MDTHEENEPKPVTVRELCERHGVTIEATLKPDASGRRYVLVRPEHVGRHGVMIENRFRRLWGYDRVGALGKQDVGKRVYYGTGCCTGPIMETDAEYARRTKLPVPVTNRRDDWRTRANGYDVVLRLQGRTHASEFWVGSGWTKDPDAADVLSCLVDDARSYDNARDFEDWAESLGYDADSRHAYAIWEKIAEESRRLRQFLGDLCATFYAAEGD